MTAQSNSSAAEPVYGHSLPGLPRDEWERLAEHAERVARCAEGFAARFGWGAVAGAMGLLHDAGKASAQFQGYIRGDLPRGGDHSTWGARMAAERYGASIGRMMAAGIAGHHAGLPDGDGLKHRLDPAHEIPEAGRWSAHIAAPPLAALRPTRFPTVPNGARYEGSPERLIHRSGFTAAFLTRFLFSCLVDADFLATEAFMTGGTVRRGVPADLNALAERLTAHLAAKEKGAERTGVNALRAEIRAHALGKAALDPGLFTLTVPTGGGKTLTSLAFALEHARLKEKRRIVYVIPFTAIVEQTADAIRDAVGDSGSVLEHHASFDWEAMAGRLERDGGDALDGLGPLRLAAENWDAPIVVTTAVQFFESLFANRTSRCRKLHNLADSVIVLDEAQTLPTRLLLPCLAALEELTHNYGASAVLCTATQPAVRSIDGALTDPDTRIDHGLAIDAARELAPRPRELASELKRVRVEVLADPVDDATIAARFAEQERMLCIVNSRAHARALFERIGHLDGAAHLTTLMCPAHRRDVLAEVRRKLKAKEPVRLVATSLIEAGVDVSFPEVWRAQAGLDSIAQAAGRCNREGELLPEFGRVVVFSPAEHKPPRALRTFQQAARPVLRDCAERGEDPLGLPAIAAYFRELYFRKGLRQLDGTMVEDQPGIMAAFARHGGDLGFPFESVAQVFRMIDEAMEPVVVPWNADAEEALRTVQYAKRPPRDALRRLALYTVGIPKKVRDRWLDEGTIAPVRGDFADALLRFRNRDLYSDETGVTLFGSDAWDAERNIW